jgi:hypothetical protein
VPGPPVDHSFRSDVATILVRESAPDRPWWLVTWLPHDEGHPSYPGFTLTSTDLSFPTDEGPLAAAQWVDKWAKETAAGRPPSEARVLDVPADEWLDVQQKAADAGWEFFAWVEPDGRFSWAVEKEGETLRSGISDSWDDARLDSIIDFPAPSGER